MAREFRFTLLHQAKQIAALLAIITLSCWTAAHAQSSDPFLDEAVQILVEKQEILHLQKSGQLDAKQAQEKMRANKERWDKFSQKIGQWPKDKQRALAEQLKAKRDAVLAQLQEKWKTETPQGQQPGSPQPEQESPSTVAAQADSGGTSTVSKGGKGADLLGLRIGMTPAEVRAIVNAPSFNASAGTKKVDEERKKLTYADDKSGAPVEIGTFVSSVKVTSVKRECERGDCRSPRDEIMIEFSEVVGREEVTKIIREKYFLPREMPSYDVLTKALAEKYGPPTIANKNSGDAPPGNIKWYFNENGTLRTIGDLPKESKNHGDSCDKSYFDIPHLKRSRQEKTRTYRKIVSAAW